MNEKKFIDDVLPFFIIFLFFFILSKSKIVFLCRVNYLMQ
jgi:hypothetical protein